MRKIVTDRAPAAPTLMSQAIESGGFIFVSGQIHARPDGSLVSGTVGEKLAYVMSNIKAILTASGSSMNDIVKVVIYVTDMAEMPVLNAAYSRYFTEPYPAREAVCVKALPFGATLEISVIAFKTQV